MRDFYLHGLPQFGTIVSTYHRGLEYRSVYGQLVGDDLVVSGEADLDIEVHGLEERRLELFSEIASFVEGLAAERMYRQAMLFLKGSGRASSPKIIGAKIMDWQREGFQLRRGFGI